MILQRPEMLWWAALAVPLIAVYLLRVRPRRKTTSAWFLWDQVLQQKKTSALFRRLRDVLSMLLMLAALVAVVAALSQPRFGGDDAAVDMILLIDVSPSMAATDRGGARIEQARKAARQIVQAMGLNRRAALAVVSDQVRYVVNLTDNHRALLSAIDDVSPGEVPLSGGALASMAADNQLPEHARIILISDGCFDGSSPAKPVELLKVGQPADNVGIVAFDMLRLPAAPDKLGLYFRLAASGSEKREINVALYHDAVDPANLAGVYPVTISAGLAKPETYTVADARSGRWILALEGLRGDALAADDIAFVVVPPLSPIRTAVAASAIDSWFLGHCVQAFERSAQIMSLVEGQAELRVSCGQVIPPDSARWHIVFRPAGQSPFWSEISGEGATAIAHVRLADHEAIRFADLDGLAVGGVRRIKPPAGAVVIAETHDGVPLIYQVAVGGQLACVVNLDPLKEDFYLRPAFTAMVYSMAVQLAGRQVGGRSSIAPGEAAQASADPKQAWRLAGPDGVEAAGRGAVTPALRSRGFYVLRDSAGERTLAVSQASVHDSMLDNGSVAATAGPVRRGELPSYWLIVVAICVMVFESVLYHRRKVG